MDGLGLWESTVFFVKQLSCACGCSECSHISVGCKTMDRLMHELCMGFLNKSRFSSNVSIFGGYSGDAQPTSLALYQWVRLNEAAGRKDRFRQG